ncbi:transcription factor cwo isoform X2 [Bicyclus anynana]|uniref:Transcription factor cwo isoform X2 n=1 Tax=Bicyclus anynana TaxID=110368 RepID=A0A6J1NAI0_BICAN|nr:transcription factor cwo isoform X2 [Bicyclus anynana]
MMETRNYWEENVHPVKYDNYNSNDGFGRGEAHGYAPPSEDEAEYPPGAYLKKGKQDPMSHRIIEKRRRDRMNNCLADLSRLIPPEYLKKGRGRVEKTEIIEMAIRHLKFLQDRVNAAERQASDEFRGGYQEAVAEAVRFLVDVQGFSPADGLCVQLATHLQRHCDGVTKGDVMLREKTRTHPGTSSSETTSSSSSSHGYAVKVIQRPELPPAFVPEPYEQDPPSGQHYPMECERVQNQVPAEGATEPLQLDGRARDALRKVRKLDHNDDYLHSYKFKNSIERRFSRSQDTEMTDAAAHNGTNGAPHGKMLKRRRALKPAPPSASTSASTSTEDAPDTSPQDTSSESPHNHHYDKPQPPTQYVPVFALNSLGKYYVPLSVDYTCIARQLGTMDSDTRPITALHPVTIHVNFPCLNYHVKREPGERQWRPM